MDLGPLEAFPGALGSERQPGRGSGTRRERADSSPHGSRRLRALKIRGQREGSRKRRVERGVRPMVVSVPGLEAQGGGSGGSSCRWAWLRAGCTPLRPPRAP